MTTLLDNTGQDDKNCVPNPIDREETNLFVRTNIGWMLQVARHYLSDVALAEDAVQNAFAKIFVNSNQFEGKVRIQAWMRRIVVNEALMILRKRKSSKEESSIDPLSPEFDKNQCRIEPHWVDVPSPDQVLVNKQAKQFVMAAIAKLPTHYRLVLLLRDIEEQSTAEVANALEISNINVKVRLHRARAALKVLLEPHMREGWFSL